MSVCRLGVGHSPRRSCCIPMGLGAWQLLMAVLDFGPISRCTLPFICPDLLYAPTRTPVAFPVPPCLVWRCVAASLFLGRTGVGIATSVPVPASSFPIHSLSRWTSPCPMAYVMPPEQWQSPARLLSRLSLLLLLPYPFHAFPNRPAVPFTRRAYVPPLRSAPRSRSCTPSEW